MSRQSGDDQGQAQGSSGARTDAAKVTLQDFCAFRCNYAGKDGEQCTQELLEDTWVTQCSHVFCPKHARQWFEGHDDCPVCRQGAVKLVRMNFGPSNGRNSKRMSLVGMTPMEIMAASETALNFWVDQKALEFQKRAKRKVAMTERQKKMEEVIRDRLKIAEDMCNRLEEDQKDLQRKIDETDKDNSRAQEEVRVLKRELAEAEDQYSDFAKRISGDQRREFFRRPLVASPAPPAGQMGRSQSGLGSGSGSGGSGHDAQWSRPMTADRGVEDGRAAFLPRTPAQGLGIPRTPAGGSMGIPRTPAGGQRGIPRTPGVGRIGIPRTPAGGSIGIPRTPAGGPPGIPRTPAPRGDLGAPGAGRARSAERFDTFASCGLGDTRRLPTFTPGLLVGRQKKRGLQD
eukprot:TRINITY_DN36233_c0_g1_i1.p1 TRINITY_DN36233_c0_g1~~TRINITY_DN36233_c0_g1_i1.p1  ORF type:complete len:400 (-),score=74.72 TRINITY_DN36233_c0_g1_i1:341-1540(-)